VTVALDVREERLLELASGGDEDAFRLLVEPHAMRLRAHCHRMLGSTNDVDDALQDVLLRAWRGLSGFDGQSSFRSWLYRITTNVCLDRIARRRAPAVRIQPGVSVANARASRETLIDPMTLERFSDELPRPEDGDSAPEGCYERREAAELAFVTALRFLPPQQCAVLVLREALGLSAGDVSRTLGTTVASVNSALQRARKSLDERLPAEGQDVTMRSARWDRARPRVRRFVDALERGDAPGIVAVLAEAAR
jgi:RNA polymerase sigma-70 factor (ECF subfamily)